MMNEILEGVLAEFKNLALIPRQSKHELKIANYLAERLKKLNAEVRIDNVGNVIADFYSTEGFEQQPIVAMQAHMDMVCVSDGSIDYNPLNDSIKLILDEEYLKAEGTSLGADDGIGIAIILYILSHVDELIGNHGAWRIIFTVDEETGMTGAKEIDKKVLGDVKYLINVDSENVDEIVIGSAGSAKIEFRQYIDWCVPTKSEGYIVKVSGLKGGHSGEAIHIKHANAIKVLSALLSELNCEICKLQGGSALNVIASEAKAIIAVDKEVDVKHICREIEYKFASEFNELNLDIQFKKIKLPDRVMSNENAEVILSVMNELISGIYKVEGVNKTSANIGTIKTTDSAFYLYYMPRFHSIKNFKQIFDHVTDVYMTSHCSELNLKSFSREWKVEDSQLVNLIMKASQNLQRDVKQRVIHGGLECSHFMEKNPKLQIVSVGTTNLNIHSPNEKLLLSSVEPTVKLIAETLKLIAEGEVR